MNNSQHIPDNHSKDFLGLTYWISVVFLQFLLFYSNYYFVSRSFGEFNKSLKGLLNFLSKFPQYKVALSRTEYSPNLLFVISSSWMNYLIFRIHVPHSINFLFFIFLHRSKTILKARLRYNRLDTISLLILSIPLTKTEITFSHISGPNCKCT